MQKPKNCSCVSGTSAVHGGRIEFLFEQSCPNVADARAQLHLALEQTGRPLIWQEWDQGDPHSPDHARQYGSPTILVDGEDVAGEPPSDAPSCRIYSMTPGRNRGVPDARLIRAALTRSTTRGDAPLSPPRRMQIASLLPVIGATLLPKLSCPACWPAYAAVLGALGVGFVDYTPVLLPLTLAFLAITLAMLAWRPRRGHAPLALGLLASAVMLIGKFGLDSDLAAYLGVLLLIGASTWNAWPKRTTLKGAC